MNIAKWLFSQGKSVPGSEGASCGRCRWCKKDMCKVYRKRRAEQQGVKYE
jgi:threonine dehydrogenase-like Zn-dependent dehydrogenase